MKVIRMIISSVNYPETKRNKMHKQSCDQEFSWTGGTGNERTLPSQSVFRDGSFRHGAVTRSSQGGCSSEEMALVWEG